MYFDEFNVGDSFPVLKKEKITRVQLVKYAGASGDFNPLHTVEEVGEQAGTGIVAHGMLIMGMAAEGITNWIPRKQIKNFKVRFKKMTRPGESIHISGKVLEKRESNTIVGEVLACNTDGEVKLAGTFEAIIPSRDA
ncbi:3-hydroxyacyl-ACP dehydratase [Oceanobacillus piezotolerans]|uniref:3-hydroxyacyl-ACP dehydratase n=1 Tax=Oceanobacillus piezotolerans TaxID=2448030 RepID=A0A498D8J5_9BACI|nr:MaoC/PaaZ C-terminal domain-containing protein [Oceanobacillus piezotolerans]RLL46866.1 3-hydroxyacyl-ACP dehydratase [Oceanobacillus piezotolerans]